MESRFYFILFFIPLSLVPFLFCLYSVVFCCCCFFLSLYSWLHSFFFWSSCLFIPDFLLFFILHSCSFLLLLSCLCSLFSYFLFTCYSLLSHCPKFVVPHSFQFLIPLLLHSPLLHLHIIFSLLWSPFCSPFLCTSFRSSLSPSSSVPLFPHSLVPVQGILTIGNTGNEPHAA